MALFGNKKRKDMAEEIKNAVDSPEDYTQQRPDIFTQSPKRVQPRALESTGSPVFVKMEKYKNILVAFESLKSSIDNLRISFTALVDMEKIRSDNMEKMKDSIDKVEGTLIDLDREFVRPSEMELPHHQLKATPKGKPAANKELDTTVSELKSQIDALKEKLKEVA